MACFWLDDELMDDPKVQSLPPQEFREKLIAAVHGQTNEFSPFLKKGREPQGAERVRPRGPNGKRSKYKKTPAKRVQS